jgi:hypothetical protein
LTSVFTLANATKFQEKIRLSKDFNWADCVDSILKDSTIVSPVKIF